MNAWIIKPKNFDPNKKYPCLCSNTQVRIAAGCEFLGQWKCFGLKCWHRKVTSSLVLDGRGTGFKGAKFKKSNV